MLSGLAASVVLSEWRGRARFCFFSALSGIFAAFCRLTKQTIGLGEVLSILVVVAVLLFKLDTAPRAMMWCAMFLGGSSLPIAGFLMYLNHLGVFHSFFQMLFVSGPAAKAGHPSDFLLRDILVAVTYWPMVGFRNIGVRTECTCSCPCDQFRRRRRALRRQKSLAIQHVSVLNRAHPNRRSRVARAHAALPAARVFKSLGLLHIYLADPSFDWLC